jgi:hypothetical protein
MADITPLSVLFVGACCLGVVGVIVLAILLFIAFVPRRSHAGRSS